MHFIDVLCILSMFFLVNQNRTSSFGLLKHIIIKNIEAFYLFKSMPLCS